MADTTSTSPTALNLRPSEATATIAASLGSFNDNRQVVIAIVFGIVGAILAFAGIIIGYVQLRKNKLAYNRV